jgi:hypothetical protein
MKELRCNKTASVANQTPSGRVKKLFIAVLADASSTRVQAPSRLPEYAIPCTSVSFGS